MKIQQFILDQNVQHNKPTEFATETKKGKQISTKSCYFINPISINVTIEEDILSTNI